MSELYERFATGGAENDVFGPDIASATTIAPTHRYHRVSGTTAIQTITPPWTGFIGEIVLVPLGLFTLGTSGNILTAVTAIVDQPIVLHCDGVSWRPVTAVSVSTSVSTSNIAYERSVTAPDGNTTTFDFADAIGTLLVAYIGGIAQLPADCSVVAGDLVFGNGVVPTDPETDRVSALFVKA